MSTGGLVSGFLDSALIGHIDSMDPSGSLDQWGPLGPNNRLNGPDRVIGLNVFIGTELLSSNHSGSFKSTHSLDPTGSLLY